MLEYEGQIKGDESDFELLRSIVCEDGDEEAQERLDFIIEFMQASMEAEMRREFITCLRDMADDLEPEEISFGI